MAKEESNQTEELVDQQEGAEAVEVEADLLEKDEVSVLSDQLSEMEDKFLRAQAEIANMRNRFQKERSGLVKYGPQNLAKDLLPAIDNLERALATEVSSEDAKSLKKGIEMVLESLYHALKENGITEIPTKEQSFDPNFHQAVQMVPAEEGQKPEQIIEVLQKGYQLQDRVLRPSMVVVAQ